MASKRKETDASDPLGPFSDPVRRWFEASFEAPTPAQEQGWPAISSGANTLICAPTGSGKTLTAFLWGIDKLAREPERLGQGVKIVYVSPLKALSYDVERNLRAPLRGIGAEIAVGLRTGDTPQRERQAMLRRPPDILITTPESLYLMISSRAREILTGVEAVIVDEIHSVAQTKRGAHLALTIERLDHLVRTTNAEGQPARASDEVADRANDPAGRAAPKPDGNEAEGEASGGGIPEDPAGGGKPIQRIGLSATQRPLERVAGFLAGPKRECAIVDAGSRKEMDLEIVVPVDDMTDPDASIEKRRDGGDSGIEANIDAAPTTRSIWPAIYPKLLELVLEHTSTIVFVNSRRGAERLARRLNELNAEGKEATPEAVPDIARAHHGSLAHEERLVIEEMLKSGQLPCLVATSSLELGIDMGAVDLVIQVESPKSVARGIQRVGRAGHSMGETSKGRIFPKFRADLLECAVVARRMREGKIEETIIPRNPLDVLAQHLVSIVAEDEWSVDDIEELVTATEPFQELGREQLENVLDMLDGRYPSERFAELRPRVAWDRAGGTVRGRKGARQLVVTNAGTIPDRGLYGVHMPDGRRVGELDEEMVYEARPGQTFLLGATTWRIEDITRDRVIVTPAPGVPGSVPFWRGDGIGRPVELGRAIGAFSREAVSMSAEKLESEYDLDPRAAQNLLAYLLEQQAATRVVPSDQSIVVERFRDEIGDWRLCVLSPFGGRLHAAWGLALAAKLRGQLGLEVDSIWSDDGIVLHLPDADEPPSADMVLIEPDEVEDLIVGELSGSALFGARFRENAARSLLLPRSYPGKRTPLWQQRLKAQSLLEVARDHPRFPVVLETYRECLRDVLDLPALRGLLGDLHSRRVTLVEVETQTASPFASSLLFDYVATYMYEGDTPNAERRAAALALDRELLAELLGQEELRELIDADAVGDVEASLQHLDERMMAKDRDALHQILRRIGDLTAAECEARTAEGYSAASMLSKLERERRAARVRIAGEERWIAIDDSGLYRDALGVPPAPGTPDAFLAPVDDAMVAMLRRYAATHGPFVTALPAGRYGADPAPALRELERAGTLVRGELLPHGTEREWCDSDVLRRIRRASLARLRQEAEAVDPRDFARFLVSWQNVDALRPAGAGPDRLREVLIPLQGVSLTPEVWEKDVLPRRLGAYNPAWLDQLTTGGEIVWIGAGASGRTGRVALYYREDVHLAGPPPSNEKLERPEGELHDTIRELLGESPRFWIDLVAEIEAEPTVLQEALWDLAWAGEVTNDGFAPLRGRPLAAAPSRQRSGRRFAARRPTAGETVQGRWSLTESLLRGAPGRGPRMRAQSELMLERYGIVTRETVLAEGVPGGMSALYGELSNLEMLGTARRGYFVEGMGGAQFALAGAVERLRSLPQADDPVFTLLATTDPANPWGSILPWPKRGESRRPSRVAGSHVLTRDGEPVIYIERGGRGIVRLHDLPGEELADAVRHLVAAAEAGTIPKLQVERVDGEPVFGSGFDDVLIEAGFSRQPRRLVAAR